MNKLPAFQFYPSDWRSDNGVQSLSYFERGVWFEILCLMHESEQRGKLLLNGKPMPDDALARLLGLDKQILTKTLTTLLDYGVASRDTDGTLINRRMIRDEILRQIRTEAGKKGGNPNLVNQNSTKTKNEVNQNSTPSSSSSSSSKKEKPNGFSKKAERIPKDFTVSQDVLGWSKVKTPDVNISREFEKFQNYWQAKSGKDAVKLDWDATLRNWLLSAQERIDTAKPKPESSVYVNPYTGKGLK